MHACIEGAAAVDSQAMKIEADSVMPFSRALIYETYRDKLVDLVPHLPNVTSIEVRERSDDGDVSRLLNIWHGAGEIPAVARKLLSQSMLSWSDHATWKQQEWICDWRIETHAFTEAISCSGCNRFVAVSENETRLEIRGEIVIDLKKVRGVPRFLAGSVGPTVEKFLVNQITPNLTRVSDGLVKYLQAGASS